MPEDVDANEGESVVRRQFEAYAYSSDLLPHHSIIEGYQNAIPDGGKDVIAIVKRQQMMTFIVQLATLFSNNLIPFILVLPILFAISAGALIEITVAAAVLIGLFTAGSAAGRVITTLRGSEGQVQLPGPAPTPRQNQLPEEADNSRS
ncbi:MAG: hypothetical protein OXN88_15900 [Chloroflexota bacterium]|nr:hypothetical protein [Chloroflexota bacterium]